MKLMGTKQGRDDDDDGDRALELCTERRTRGVFCPYAGLMCLYMRANTIRYSRFAFSYIGAQKEVPDLNC